MNKTISSAITLVLISIAAFSPQAKAAPLKGKVIEYIEPTSWESMFRSSLDDIASPSENGAEMNEALLQFPDLYAAQARLQELKNEAGAPNGNVFAGFTYDKGKVNYGTASVTCGVTRTTENDWDEIFANHAETRFVMLGSWKNIQHGTRADRVRSIARCLASLPGMPKLKPAPHEIKFLYIDDASYAQAATWLRATDPKAVQGTPEQYNKAFRCLVAQAAREDPDATGDTVLVRTFVDHEEDEYVKTKSGGLLGPSTREVESYETNFRWNIFAVLDQKRALELMKETKPDIFSAPWPAKSSTPEFRKNGIDGAMREILPGVEKNLAGCRRQAGLFELPPSNVQVGATATPCTH